MLYIVTKPAEVSPAIVIRILKNFWERLDANIEAKLDHLERGARNFMWNFRA